MRKNALAITVSTLVAGVFGAFLRWLQCRNIFEETGLAASGAAVSVVYVIYSLLAAAGIAGLSALWLRRFRAPAESTEALRVSSVVPAIFSWVLCAVFAVAGILLMFSAGAAEYPLVQRFFGAAAVVAGFCLPAIPCRNGAGEASFVSRKPASGFLALFCCFWLVYCYLGHAENPVLWAYVPEVLAVAAVTLAVYYVAAWCFDRCAPTSAFLTVQLAVFLILCALPSAPSGGVALLLCASGAYLVMLEYILLANLREPDDARF